LKYLIYAIGFIYLLISFNYGVNIYDEGLVLVGGMRVLDGDLPYSDFWTIYAPGTYYLSAFLQLLTTQIWLQKFIAIVVTFIVAIQLNSIYRLLTHKRQYYVFIAAIILSGFGLKYLNASSLGLMFALTGIYYGLKYFKTSDNRMILKSGLSIGITALFRHDFAFYIFVPFLLSLLFDVNKKNLLNKIIALFKVLLPAILVFILLGIFTGFNNIFDQLVVFPLTKFSSTRSLPFPLLWEARAISDSMSNYFYNAWISIMFLVPPIIAIANYIIFRKHNYASLYIFYGLLVLLFFNQALNRSDYSHLLPALLLALPLVYSIIASVNTKFYRVVALGLSAVFFLIIPIGKKLNYAKKNYISKVDSSSTIPTLNFIHLEESLVQRYDFIKEVESNIIKGGNTFIGLKDMSSIEINDVLSYYILGIKPNTKYHELHPGIADNKYYQSELLEQLITQNQYVILLDIKPLVVLDKNTDFNEKLDQFYSYVIKTPSIDLLINKNAYPKKDAR